MTASLRAASPPKRSFRHRLLVTPLVREQPCRPICVQTVIMRERTASHRDSNTSPAPDPASSQARHTFPRILTTATFALTLGLAIAGCHTSSAQASAQSPSGDPSNVNDADAQSTCPTGQVLMSDGSCQAGDQAPPQPTAGAPAQNNAPQSTAPQQQDQQPQQYAAAPAPPAQQYSAPPQDQSSDNDDSDVYDTNPYADQTYQQDAYNDGYQQGYDAAVQASEPPPELPVYAQPACPDVGYIWNPGYWSWGQYGYYWVPGVWVLAPYTGALWTPPWWGFFGGHYRWHHGYWGSHVGFYGGIPYGYGYTGQGYHGGYWDHDRFMYNRSVTNINSTHITNVYNVRVVNVVNNRVSYNGGRGGLNVRPTPSEFAAMREPHVRPLPAQVQHRTQAAQNRQQYVRFNGGKPAALAAPRPIQTRPVHVAPTVVNPGVHGATRPAPAVARPAPGTRPTTTAAPARPNQPVTRPGVATPTHTQPVAPARPGATPTNRPAPRPEAPAQPSRPQPTHTQPIRQPAPESRPAPQPARPVQQPRPEARPTPQPARPVQQPRPEARPTPEPARPVQQPRQEARPQPQPARPAPQPMRSEPQPRPEARPQPQPSRPAPQARPEPQRAEPQREAPRENPHEQPHR